MLTNAEGMIFYRESLLVPATHIPKKILESAIFTEAREGGQLRVVLPATRLDWENLNQRTYPTSVMQKAIQNEEFQREMKGGYLIGAGDDHPDTPFVPPIKGSHIVTNAFVQKLGNESYLMNDWLTLPTSNGRDLRGLIEGGAAFGVSIRGFGRMNEGKDKGIMAEYRYLATDAVGEPSAKLYLGKNVPNCEVVEAYKTPISVIEEDHVRTEGRKGFVSVLEDVVTEENDKQTKYETWRDKVKEKGAVRFKDLGREVEAYDKDDKKIGTFKKGDNDGTLGEGVIYSEIHNAVNDTKTALTEPGGDDSHVHAYDPSVSGGLTSMAGIDNHVHSFSSSAGITAPGGTDGHQHKLMQSMAATDVLALLAATDSYDKESKSRANLAYAIRSLEYHALGSGKKYIADIVAAHTGKNKLEQLHWSTLQSILESIKKEGFKYIQAKDSTKVSNMPKLKKEDTQLPDGDNKLVATTDPQTTSLAKIALGDKIVIGNVTSKVTSIDGETVVSKNVEDDGETTWGINDLERDANGNWHSKVDGAPKVPDESDNARKEAKRKGTDTLREAVMVGGVEVTVNRPAGANYVVFTPKDPTQYLTLQDNLTAQGALLYQPSPEGSVAIILGPEADPLRLPYVITTGGGDAAAVAAVDSFNRFMNGIKEDASSGASNYSDQGEWKEAATKKGAIKFTPGKEDGADTITAYTASGEVVGVWGNGTGVVLEKRVRPSIGKKIIERFVTLHTELKDRRDGNDTIRNIASRWEDGPNKIPLGTVLPVGPGKRVSSSPYVGKFDSEDQWWSTCIMRHGDGVKKTSAGGKPQAEIYGDIVGSFDPISKKGTVESRVKVTKENADEIIASLIASYGSTAADKQADVDALYMKFGVTPTGDLAQLALDLKALPEGDLNSLFQDVSSTNGVEPPALDFNEPDGSPANVALTNPVPVDLASFNLLKARARKVLSESGKAAAMRLFMGVENRMNGIADQKILNKAVTMLDELKNETFGSFEVASPKKKANEAKMADEVNSLSRMITEAHTIAEQIDSMTLSKEQKASIKRLLDYTVACEDLVASGATLVSANKNEVAKLIESLHKNFIIEGDVKNLSDVISILNQSALSMTNLNSVLGESSSKISTLMRLVESLRIFYRREFNTLKKDKESATKLVEHLRSRIKLMVDTKESRYVAPVEIAETADRIIAQHPGLRNFREEMVRCAKTPDEVRILAKKYLNIRDFQTTATVSENVVTKQRLGSGEKMLPDGMI